MLHGADLSYPAKAEGGTPSPRATLRRLTLAADVILSPTSTDPGLLLHPAGRESPKTGGETGHVLTGVAGESVYSH